MRPWPISDALRDAAGWARGAGGAAVVVMSIVLSAPAWGQAGTVLFWTADDCGYCKVWRNGDRHAEYLAAAQPLGIRLVTVRKPRIADPASAYVWPTGASAAPGSEAPKLLPTFDFVCRGRLLHRLSGLAQWDSFWHQQLQRLAAECADISS